MGILALRLRLVGLVSWPERGTATAAASAFIDAPP